MDLSAADGSVDAWLSSESEGAADGADAGGKSMMPNKVQQQGKPTCVPGNIWAYKATEKSGSRNWHLKQSLGKYSMINRKT